jgi:predicted Zn-dependent protease
LEADRVGIQLAHCAGFDPSAAVRLFFRMRSLGGDRWPLGGYFSTHPSLEIRIHELNRHIKPLPGPARSAYRSGELVRKQVET